MLTVWNFAVLRKDREHLAGRASSHGILQDKHCTRLDAQCLAGPALHQAWQLWAVSAGLDALASSEHRAAVPIQREPWVMRGLGMRRSEV